MEKQFVSIKTKLTVNTMATISIIFVVVLSVIVAKDIWTVNRTIKKAEHRIRKSIIARGNTLANNNSMAMRGMADDYSFSAIQELVSSTVKDDPDITYGIFMDADHMPWAYASPDNPSGTPKKDTEPLTDEISKWAGSLKKPGHKKYKRKHEKIIEFTAPVHVGDEIAGYIRYGISTESMRKELQEALADGKRIRNYTISILILLGIVSLLVSYLIVRHISEKITRPIISLVNSAETIAKGNFDVPVTSESNDEIGSLADAFRHMKDMIDLVLHKTDDLILAIENGKLETRGDSSAFTGVWHQLVAGINNLIDAFISPFNITASYIERISGGDIPKKVIKESKGDFNKINNNLNMLVDSINETVRVAEAIATGNLTVDVTERSEEDRMMKALNLMIQKLNEIKNETDSMIKSVGTGMLDIRGNAEAFEGGWKELVADINQLIEGLSNAIIAAAAMSQEMELAKKIQTALLPGSSRDIHPDFEIAATMITCDEVGGDYYDITFDREESLWFGIGDVSGHGVTPGLIMMMAQTVHTAVVTNYRHSPNEVVSMINKVLFKNVHERLGEKHFMTFTALKYMGSGNFEYAGAHLSLIVYRKKEKKCELVKTQGVFLNFIKDISKATKNLNLTLDIGDVLVLYTDGLTEAKNSENELLDLDGFVKVVEDHAEKSAQDMMDAAIEDVMTWCNRERADDMTLVVIRRIQ